MYRWCLLQLVPAKTVAPLWYDLAMPLTAVAEADSYNKGQDTIRSSHVCCAGRNAPGKEQELLLTDVMFRHISV